MNGRGLFSSLLAVFALAVSSGAFQATPSNAVDVYLRERMSAHQIPGLSVAVVKDGRIAKLKSYGLANIEFNVPVTEETSFQIYSVTKIFAGIAAMKLVEERVLALDTPVTRFVNDAPSSWSGITVRHLLDHTSGLPELNDNPEYARLPEEKKRVISSEDAIRYATAAPLRAKPGEQYAYHRFSYTLFGAIVERATGTSFDVFLQQRVFTPLGMTSAQFGDWESVIKGRATAYNRSEGALKNWLYSFGFGNPGAGLNASISDVAKLMVGLQSQTVLGAGSLDIMWTPTRLPDGSTPGYALGWSVGEHRSRRVVGHEGGGAAWIAHFPAERLSVAILCNLNGSRADEIQNGVADLFISR